MKYNTSKIIQKTLNDMIRRDMEGWPPVCTGWMYQPKRPEQMQKEENALRMKTEKPNPNL